MQKIAEISTNSIGISWRRYLWRKEDFSKNDAYNFNHISSIKELSIEEIQEYLPNGHEDKIPESKYKVGDELEVCEGGWKLSEGDFHRDMIEINVKSNSYTLKGKCINTKWSSKNKIWFYEIENCSNMISESGVRLVNDKKYERASKYFKIF